MYHRRIRPTTIRPLLTGVTLVCALAGYAPGAHGQESPPSSPDPGATARPGHTAGVQGAGEPRPSGYDRVWQRLSQWYRNDSNPVVQQVSFTGRYQHEFATVSAEEGDHDEWNVRRLRLGPRITLFRTFTLHTEVELNPQERDPLYMRLTDAYLQWSRDRAFVVTAGKHGVAFTMDGSTSSKELLAIDRSNLSNNLWFPQEYLPGLNVSGRRAAWVYRAGAYSAGEANREFGDFTGGLVGLGSLGYDFARAMGVKEALLTGSYVYQQPDARNSFTRSLEHIGSVTFRFEAERWGLQADASVAAGYLGQSGLRAVMAMPFVNLTPKLQAVGRYVFVGSDEPNGVRLSTYENRLTSGRGDQYTELYLGANYYLYGHKLKLQSGLQFADMRDRAGDGGAYSGVSWTTGLRVSW